MRDLTFVIGHSTSRKRTEWQMILAFMDRMISVMSIDQSTSQIALVTCSKESRVVWKLNDKKDMESLKRVCA